MDRLPCRSPVSSDHLPRQSRREAATPSDHVLRPGSDGCVVAGRHPPRVSRPAGGRPGRVRGRRRRARPATADAGRGRPFRRRLLVAGRTPHRVHLLRHGRTDGLADRARRGRPHEAGREGRPAGLVAERQAARVHLLSRRKPGDRDREAEAPISVGSPATGPKTSIPPGRPTAPRIVFTSKRDGHAQIYVMAADGSGQRRLVQGSLERPEAGVVAGRPAYPLHLVPK